MPKKGLKLIYNKDYYRAQKLTHDPLFKKGISKILSNFKKLGSPVPLKGFIKYQDFESWNKRYWDCYAKIEYSNDEKSKAQLPLPYGNEIENLLEKCGIPKRDKKFKDFVEEYIFFNKKELIEPFFDTKWILNDKTKEMEFYIKVYAHTTKEHITAFWGEILEEQKILKENQRNRKILNLERDFHIYNIYRKIKARRPSRLNKAQKEKGLKLIETEVWVIAKKKYPQLPYEQVRKSIERIKKIG